MYNPLDYNINALNKLSPKKGRLLYLGKMGKRPNWKVDYEKDVAELVEEMV